MQILKALAAIIAVPTAIVAGINETAKLADASRKSGGLFREIGRELKSVFNTAKSIGKKND